MQKDSVHLDKPTETSTDPSVKPVSEEQQQIDLLKVDLNQKIQAAEQAAYKYFCACPLGRERERAHEVYVNILYARRTV